jgi:hypothetical protein
VAHTHQTVGAQQIDGRNKSRRRRKRGEGKKAGDTERGGRKCDLGTDAFDSSHG